MAKLKAGTVADFENSLAAEMEVAMKTEWQRVKSSVLPGGAGEEDRKILFVAVARGLLKYLTDHRGDIPTTRNNGGTHSHRVLWEYQ
jgi:hypothetical protein